MALRTPETTKEQDAARDRSQTYYDDKFNDLTKDLSDQENNAASGYNDNLDDHPVNSGDASGKSGDLNSDPAKNTNNVKDQEENAGGWTTKISGRGVYGNKPFERGRKLSRANVQAILKRKGPLGLIITIFLGGSIGFGSLFGGALAPMAFMENVTDDLNDQLAAADIRSNAMLRNKIPRGDVKESIAGCTKLSIRCKFKTMSAKQVARYERAGIKVVGVEKTIGLSKRIAPTSYTFRGQPMNAQEFNNALKTNSNLRIAYKRALNMKFLTLNDSSFIKRTLAGLGISKRPPELKGSHQDRVNALMNKAQVTDSSKIRFIPAVDADGKQIFYLEGDATKRSYSPDEKTRMEASVARATKPPSQIGSNILKGVSILGYWDLACTVKNMIGGASVAAKALNQYELAEYAMPILTLTSQMKAGEISVEDGQVLGEFFGATDSRREIVDLEQSVSTDPVTHSITPRTDTVMKNNPNFGKNVMDSPLYQLSSLGQFNSVSLTESQYSLGMGQNLLLASFSGFADILNVLGEVAECEFAQNWAVRGIGLVAGVVGLVLTGGTLTAGQFAASGGLIVASIALEFIINNALSNSIITPAMSEAPIDRAAATWTGTAVTLGESAKNRAMMPANTEQIMAYNQLQVESKNDYIAVARQESGPFDIMNQYSFLGSLSRSILPYVGGSNNINTTLSNTLSFTTNSFSKLFTPSAYAATLDPARFKQCDDQGYADIGETHKTINPDVQCNVRYVMPSADLALDTDAVALYMETNGYVEEDTTTGLPPGYIPPAPQEAENYAMAMLNGMIDAFYDRRNYGDTEKSKEYGKFLDFCVYRLMPFGETYQETGEMNGVGKEWKDGSKCLDTDSEMMSNFRIYTFDKTLSEAEDEDAIVIPDETTTPTTGTLTPGENSGNVNVNGWSFPTTAGTTLSSPFGPRGRAFHTGIDLNIGSGSPFYATRDGVVQTREYNIYSIDGGRWCPVTPSESPNQKDIWITHNVDGVTYTSVYAHMSQFLKKTGDIVKAGDLIGYTGGTGCSNGPHVHFEIWQGVATPSIPGPGMLNPWPLINK